jgi:hypothetical protein
VNKRTAKGLAAALTFVVAAVGGVIGNRITDKITPALVIFVILLVLGAIPSYLIARGDVASTAPAPPPDSVPEHGSTQPPAPVPQPVKVIAEGNGSVAVGRDNTGSITTNVTNQPGRPRPNEYQEPKLANPRE